jgi:probable rRNA maturation factor
MLEVIVDAGPRWSEDRDWTQLADTAARAALAGTPHGDLVSNPSMVELSVKLSDDAEVQTLNAAYRGPMIQFDLLDAIDIGDDGETLLGDIILAHETCAREAEERCITLEQHVTHLIVHGTLHLVGYDHMDDVEAEAMESIETRALASIGVADPYGDRGPGFSGAIDDTGI